MNLYLLTHDRETSYDTFDSCVVCAKNENEAKNIKPSDSDYEWPQSPSDIKAVLIGVANKTYKAGDIILSSFNAG